MDFNFIWETVVTFVFGILALRVAGRKSLAQMTAAETVVMIAVGTILIEPLVGKEILKTFAAVTIVIITLYILERLQIRWRFMEKLLSGTSILVIEHGQIKVDNLKKLRMTMHQLEMHLRQSSIAKIEEVEYATIEPNGQLGYTLKESAQPVSKADVRTIINRLDKIENKLSGITTGVSTHYHSPGAVRMPGNENATPPASLFREVKEDAAKKPS